MLMMINHCLKMMMIMMSLSEMNLNEDCHHLLIQIINFVFDHFGVDHFRVDHSEVDNLLFDRFSFTGNTYVLC